MPTAYRKQYGGADCITCCPVEIQCDCALISCVMDFVRYTMNVNRDEYTGHTSKEVFVYGTKLVGLAALGTYERPVIDGTPQVTFGRSLIQAVINDWDVNPDEVQLFTQEINRVFEPYLCGFVADKCACDEANENKVVCTALECLMTTIKSFGEIGLTQQPPYTLDEWADGGICGACYTDCAGDDYIFEKQIAA